MPLAYAPTLWDINLRANLRLWPAQAPNIRAMCTAIGAVWDDQEIAERYFSAEPSQDKSRAVRQTFEAMAYEGLLYRDSADRLTVTALGDYVLTFLGLIGPKAYANEANRVILATPLIYGLSVLTEVRVIWSLMRQLDDRLTNEELNRAMLGISSLDDVDEAVVRITDARRSNDPTLIGPRLYEDEKYGSDKESDQRKAINPHFLLAGGGGVFIDMQAGARTLLPASIRMIDGALRTVPVLLHAGTGLEVAQAISKASLAPARHKVGAS